MPPHKMGAWAAGLAAGTPLAIEDQCCAHKGRPRAPGRTQEWGGQMGPEQGPQLCREQGVTQEKVKGRWDSTKGPDRAGPATGRATVKRHPLGQPDLGLPSPLPPPAVRSPTSPRCFLRLLPPCPCFPHSSIGLLPPSQEQSQGSWPHSLNPEGDPPSPPTFPAVPSQCRLSAESAQGWCPQPSLL